MSIKIPTHTDQKEKKKKNLDQNILVTPLWH